MLVKSHGRGGCSEGKIFCSHNNILQTSKTRALLLRILYSSKLERETTLRFTHHENRWLTIYTRRTYTPKSKSIHSRRDSISQPRTMVAYDDEGRPGTTAWYILLYFYSFVSFVIKKSPLQEAVVVISELEIFEKNRFSHFFPICSSSSSGFVFLYIFFFFDHPRTFPSRLPQQVFRVSATTTESRARTFKRTRKRSN